MAKKKENELSYLQMPLPSGGKYYKMTKRSWQGMNLRQTVDTGCLSFENNISTLEAPWLTPSQEPEVFKGAYSHPIGLFGFDGFLIAIYRVKSAIYVDYITTDEGGFVDEVYVGTLTASGATAEDEYPRCVVQFNVYDAPTDVVSGSYVKKLLIFPDKKSMDFEITEDDFEINDMDVLVKEFTPTDEEETPPDSASRNYYYRNSETSDVYRWVDDESDSDNSGWKVSVPPAMPDIKYAAVHLSRLFGVDDARVYASGYNDYTNWNLDTVDEYNESNAWCSAAQSNVRADGVFTGITVFQGHIVCFKRDFMHEIYNTKNPFRIQDIFAKGTIDHRSIQDVDGKLIFVSDDDVKIYTGSNPRVIGYNLNISSFENAVSGTDGRNYFLYCEDENGDSRFFTYDSAVEQWSEQSVSDEVLSFAHNKNGMYMLLSDGYIYKLDSGDYSHKWSFETDLITNGTVDIKHIKKIQMLADLEKGAYIKVYALYDDEAFNKNKSHLLYESSGYGRKTVRVKPRNTANYGFKLHIEGYGYAKIYELELFLEDGGGLYV